MDIFKIFRKSAQVVIFNIFERLYDYQQEVVKITSVNKMGIICMPTGVGKTFCQAAIIADDILKHRKEFRMYVVNAPRIVLTYQLMKEVYGFLVKEGIEARYMFVHSGGKIDEIELEVIRENALIEIPYSQIGSGTGVPGILDMMKKSKKQDLPVIFFSTYNSAERIEMARANFTKQLFSIIMNDEAHYLVQEQFHDILNTLKSDRCYFFTATTINTPSDTGRGMNNKESYGEILYNMTPREAIERGKMVRPRLHFVTTDGVYNRDDFERSLNRIIKNAFEQHAEKLTKTEPKILVSTKGTQDIINFLKSPEYTQLRQSGVDIYAVASNPKVGNNINGVAVRRQEFLKRLKEDGTNPTKKLIVLHYDILAEGVDVSGFSGILPLRTLIKSKFLQTYGRSARPDMEDRIKIDLGELSPRDLELLNKPYAYIIIPIVYNGNEDDVANVTQLIRELRSFGYKPSELIVSTDRTHGTPEMDEPEGANIVERRIPILGRTIDDLYAQFEAEELAKLDPITLLDKLYPNL